MKNPVHIQPAVGNSLGKLLLSCCLVGFGASAPIAAMAQTECDHLADPHRIACENRLYNAELGEEVDKNTKGIADNTAAIEQNGMDIETNEMARMTD
ncbi:MAG: hypothetical protein OXJ53_10250, partial [Gammaproteobacteria bacterium]|nr:hypothetical protein [Gammaproteobacteria bacterium]